ncbi:hypothetical protein CEXT_111021 [Caerostris extrusa]|uniref:Uncharacterized protein n=1 Tax=Caerostris extrusa TaxID=172846 RepID=A0AAV4X3N7_CAEEX|nr:hypothetical protein CEXT_111021 [Caerostris extrusa]
MNREFFDARDSIERAALNGVRFHSSSRPTNATAGKRGDEVIYSAELQRKPLPDSRSVIADSRARIECDLFGCSMEAWELSHVILFSTDMRGKPLLIKSTTKANCTKDAEIGKYFIAQAAATVPGKRIKSP